jgi:hypothetical protein
MALRIAWRRHALGGARLMPADPGGGSGSVGLSGGGAVAVDGKGGSADDDVEMVDDRPSAGRPPPVDTPGAEPEGLSRTDSRAALVTANTNSHQEVGEAASDGEDEGRRGHILDGESGSRGGHRHGTGRPGKTEFPADWDDDTATDHIVDVGRKPDTVEMQDNGRWRAQGERDGVQVTAIIRPDGRIWTAWPEPGGRGVVENPRES